MTDLQDPLPESDFRWRRIFSYAAACVLLTFVGWIIYRLSAPKELASTAFWILMVLWWIITYYMIAPSAEQIARIIQSARVMRTVATVTKEPPEQPPPPVGKPEEPSE